MADSQAGLTVRASGVAVILLAIGGIGGEALFVSASRAGGWPVFWALGSIALGLGNIAIGWRLARGRIAAKWLVVPVLTSLLIISPILLSLK
jgi:hypothetical protein